MKILLFGKTGQVGWELERALAPLGVLYSLGPNELNLMDLSALKRVIIEKKPNIIVNASAYTAVDRAEKEAEIAMHINAEAPKMMALVAKELRAVLIHYSTDYVFDGVKDTSYSEEDEANPINIYGQSKCIGEKFIEDAGAAYIILRTSWVYSLRADSFVTKVLLWSRKQEAIRVVSDQIGSPTWARALAETTSLMLARGASDSFTYFSERSGIYHLGGTGSISRFDFAREIVKLDPRRDEHVLARIEPAFTKDFPTAATRPLKTPLNCSKFEQTFDISLPAWDKALKLAMSA